MKTQFFTITLTVSHRQYEWQSKIGITKGKEQIYTQINLTTVSGGNANLKYETPAINVDS